MPVVGEFSRRRWQGPKQMYEIEHRYIVKDSFKPSVADSDCICIEQGFLSLDPLVRIRVTNVDSHGILTTKLGHGIKRIEVEGKIPLYVATDYLEDLVTVEKNRYSVIVGSQHWEVDIYTGRLTGLVIAELESDSVVPPQLLPQWVYPYPITEEPWFTTKTLLEHTGEELLRLQGRFLKRREAEAASYKS